MDTITLTGVHANGTHGVLAFEHERPQTFVVDVTLHLDLAAVNVSIFLILSNSNTLQANSYYLLQFNSSRSMTISIVSHSHINKDNY